MCPDIETFAPLISAAFGPGAHPAQALPVRLADRALRQVNPLLDVVARLLELAAARLTAAQVLDLLAAAPVRRRFGLDDGDLDRLRELAVGSGVRWGLDAAHRRPFKLEAFGQNTWAAGLDRLLLGVAMPGERVAGHRPARGGRAGRHRRASVGWPSSSSGWRACSGSCPANGRWPSGRPRSPWALELLTARPPRPGRSVQARAELAEAAHVAGPHAAHGAAGASPTSAACWPSGCAAGPPAPGSAPAR